MATKKRVLINSVRDMSYNRLFDSDTFEVTNVDSKWVDCDLLLLVGAGSDVGPDLYNAKKIRECGHVDKEQDSLSMRLIDEANKRLIPIVGICKGAQQLCVSKGGHLIQHVPRVSSHDVLSHVNDRYIGVPADHHQVMVPQRAREMNILMRNADTHYPDVVMWDYSQKKDLAVQFHPEWANETHAVRRWFTSFISKAMLA